MSTERFSWLHLTDLHYGLEGQRCLWPNLRTPFFEDLTKVHELTGPWQAVLFTGDLVQSGKSEQFEKLQAEFLDRLWMELKKLGSGDAVLLAVPGNHDLFRELPPRAALDMLRMKGGFDHVAETFWQKPDGEYRQVVNEAFGAYRQWWDIAPRKPHLTPGLLPGDFACTIEHGGQRIGIVGLNTTFLQLAGGDYRGRLAWHASQVNEVCGGAVDDWTQAHDLCLLLSHQGPDWLSPKAREHGESEVAPAGRFDLHLFGHMHETNIEEIRRGGNPRSTRLCQCPSVFGMEHWGEPPKEVRSHGYMVGQVRFDETVMLRLWPRRATKGTGPWRYVPDHEHAYLEADGGTISDPLRPGRQGERPERSRPEILTTTVVAGTAAAGPHSTLPSPRTFFGREEELTTIARALHPEQVGWGIMLDGPGGIGKTALALAAAHRAPGEQFPLKLFITAKGRYLELDGVRRIPDHQAENFQPCSRNWVVRSIVPKSPASSRGDA